MGLLRSRGQDLTQSLSLRASQAAPEGRVQTQVMQTKPLGPSPAGPPTLSAEVGCLPSLATEGHPTPRDVFLMQRGRHATGLETGMRTREV